MKFLKQYKFRRCMLRTFLYSICLLSVMNIYSQMSSSVKNAVSKSDWGPKIDADGVRVDVTVFDHPWRQVTDLTAADFEVFQDGKRQIITACTYVMGSTAQNPQNGSTILARDKYAPKTLLFVVDDLSMNSSQLQYIRMALQRLVESQMDPGDMVAILQTSHGVGAKQLFSSEKQLLLARIADLRMPIERIHDDPVIIQGFNQGFNTINNLDLLRDYNASVNPVTSDPYYSRRSPDASSLENRQAGPHSVNLSAPVSSMNDRMQERKAAVVALESTNSLIRYCIRALQDMPGRKSLVLMSPKYQVFDREPMEKIVDSAFRAGAVLFAVDTSQLRDAYSLLDCRLAQLTGGRILHDGRLLYNGLQFVLDALKGYYLLSYAPPPEKAFKQKGGEGPYHRITVKVKRRDVNVHSRDGFIGGHPDATAGQSDNSLQAAILSPFLNNDLDVNQYSGYAYAPKTGFKVKSRLHLDGKNLDLIDQKNGHHTLSLQLSIAAVDAEGITQDSKSFRRQFQIKNEDISQLKILGVDCDLDLPVKGPGGYYIRTAAKDLTSGKIGSSYRFIKIPDLKTGRLTLSSVFIVNRSQDDSVMPKSIEESNAFENENNLRPFVPGNHSAGGEFSYTAVVYNAKADKGSSPDIEIQSIVMKDGKVVYQGKPETVNSTAVEELGGVPIVKKLALGEAISEGRYQLVVNLVDKRAKKNSNSDIQAIEFEIQAKK
jgi:VWFA-related protein